MEISPEQKRKTAQNINNFLLNNRNKASLSGFMDGTVLYTTPPARRIRITKLNISEDYDKFIHTKSGFTADDIEQGIISITESEFLNPNWPVKSFIEEPLLRNYNMSGLGRVVVKNFNLDESKFKPSSLEPVHQDAVRIIAFLSEIPVQILNLFGNYDEYLRALGQDFEPSGIETPQRGPLQSVYIGGLGIFVRALEIAASGQLSDKDSVYDTIIKSFASRNDYKDFFQNTC